MADGYLESHYAEYEKRKAEWLRRKHNTPHPHKPICREPEDEAL